MLGKKEFENQKNDKIADEMLYDARSRLVNICLITLLITGFGVLPTFILKSIKYGICAATIHHIITLIVGTPIILMRNKFSLKIRTLTLLAIAVSSSYFGLTTLGIVGSSFFGMGMLACTVAALVIGKRFGFALLATSMIFFIFVMNNTFSDNSTLNNFLKEYITTRTSWFYALSGFALPVFMLIMGIDEMHKILKGFVNKIVSNTNEIEKQNAFRAAMFDATDSFIIITDIDGNITDMNKACENATGYCLSEITGKPFNKIFFKEDKQLEIPKRFNNNDITRYEDRWNSKNSTPLLVNWAIRPMAIKGNDISYWFISGIDMTEYRSLERKLVQSEKMESIGKLAGGISHDFNNMLTGIIGSTQMIHFMIDEKSEAQEYVNTILTTSQRAATLVRQLLNFSRLEPLPSEVMDINTIINDTITLLKRGLPDNIKIKYEYNPEYNLFMEGENAQIVNALLNLGINAKDAMSSGGELTFSTGLKFLNKIDLEQFDKKLNPGHFIQIDVKDTGPGIPKEIMSNIFEPFHTTKPVGKGTGLGLSSVYGTIKRHNGIIKVYTETGIGTKFTLYFPTTNKNIDTNQIMPSIATKLIPWKILLVDDEESILKVTGNLLKDFSSKLHIANNGLEALEILNNNNWEMDLVLLDWIMPVMNGKKTLEKIVYESKSINVIVTSGFCTDQKFIEKISSRLKVKFLPKPYTQEELLKKIVEIQNQN